MTTEKDLHDADKPLTILKATFDDATLEAFVERCLASKKYIRDFARRLVIGLAGTTTYPWPKELKDIVADHFGMLWDDIFTEEGKRLQFLAKVLHNQRSKETMRAIKGPSITRSIATKLLSVCKDIDRHNGSVEVEKVVGKPEFKVKYTTETKRKLLKVYELHIGPHGIVEDDNKWEGNRSESRVHMD